ncbi:MnhB domain-containing protein [Shouchella lonarensis]|uniref:Multisubunit sodium/proton antiporter, MrpB subunit n=1 Tax=Shouchella lonarensis TaxID=1464122 RepID=A0A1G6KF98_9BACI|nr:MnhB domain-containing protein [Shouchella lonarensis]SDC29634.1 multisubunit sodium/proton antiporter, MrpB subunit [Shouchella lonarensis]
MKFSRSHDILQRTFITIVIYFLLAFALYLFFAGHNNPGGGFIGGLMAACAFILVYVVLDKKQATAVLRISFVPVIAIGLLLTIVVGFIGVIFGKAYLEHFFDYFHFPLFGKTELTTALPFDLGIFLVVIAVTMVITLTIAEDDQ